MNSSSPQGRIFQVEYAQEAVKQGSVVVGLVSKTHAVLAAIKVRLSRPTLNYIKLSNSIVAQRRRSLLIPEEDHTRRLTLWCRSCRSRLRCPRPLQLHEATIPRLPINI